jgi:hypothetical protein
MHKVVIVGALAVVALIYLHGRSVQAHAAASQQQGAQPDHGPIVGSSHQVLSYAAITSLPLVVRVA